MRGRKGRLGWPVLVGVLVIGGAAISPREPLTLPAPANGAHPATAAFRIVQSALPTQPLRTVVYPYSVIPGGARTRAELSDAIGRDQVVALHYATFKADHAGPVHVATPRRVHVSYRLGDKVYWTRRTVALHPGEMLLTDGAHEIRARCGNRIADDVIGETSPFEPSEVVLDTPFLQADQQPAPGLQPLQVYNLFAASGIMPPGFDGGLSVELPAAGGYSPSGPGVYGGVPGTSGTPVITPSDDASGPPPDNPGEPPIVDPPLGEPPGPPPVVPPGPPVLPPGPPEPPGPPPPTQVPEPGTMMLLAAGCAILTARQLSRRS
jgi:PEP-CTERM motif